MTSAGILVSVLTTDDLLLTRAQRDLYAELEGDRVEDLERFAVVLVARVVILVRHRCVNGREPKTTLAHAEKVHDLVRRDPFSPDARAAIWSLVEWLTRWPWGPGAQGAIDRLVVAGVISDRLAPDPS